MLPVLDLVLQMILGVAVNAWIVRRDVLRLAETDRARYARCWNAASFWSAVVGFGPLAVVVHFVRTRRSVTGLLVGFAWAGAGSAVLAIAAELLAAAHDLLAPAFAIVR